VKVPIKVKTQLKIEEAPTINSNELESDVAVSPSPDRKLRVQNKAINMPHDTSKLRGMAIRKNQMHLEKAQTPVIQK